jgi:hypothetical protein
MKHRVIIQTAGIGEAVARNDDGKLAKEILAQIAAEEQRSGVDPQTPLSRQQRRALARKEHKDALVSESDRKNLIRRIHQKAEEMHLPFQVLVQRMMDSEKENLVKMAKIIRRIPV